MYVMIKPSFKSSDSAMNMIHMGLSYYKPDIALVA